MTDLHGRAARPHRRRRARRRARRRRAGGDRDGLHAASRGSSAVELPLAVPVIAAGLRVAAVATSASSASPRSSASRSSASCSPTASTAASGPRSSSASSPASCSPCCSTPSSSLGTWVVTPWQRAGEGARHERRSWRGSPTRPTGRARTASPTRAPSTSSYSRDRPADRRADRRSRSGSGSATPAAAGSSPSTWHGAARALPSARPAVPGLAVARGTLQGDAAYLVPSLIVLVLLAIPPILSGTYAGVEGVDPAARDAAKGHGHARRARCCARSSFRAPCR